MRLALVLVVLLSACESRYGLYLTIDGDSRGIAFDQVELYFGKPLDLGHYTTPMQADVTGQVYKRKFDRSDIFPVELDRANSKLSTTFWVPANDQNQQLGAYVAAVVLAHDPQTNEARPVGIGELFDVKIDADRVTKYDLELEPYPLVGVERWGSQPSCLSWQRVRGGKLEGVGVVREDDLDCDQLATAVDCDDMCPAGVLRCSVGNAFCQQTTDACTLGCNVDGMCQPTTCVPSLICSSGCISQWGNNIADRIACGLNTVGTTHFEAYVRLDQDSRPCSEMFSFSIPGHACKMAILEATVPPGSGGDYAFEVTDDGSNCLVKLASPSGADLVGEYHLLISFATDLIGPRATVVVGIQPEDAGVMGCPDPKVRFDTSLPGVTLCP